MDYRLLGRTGVKVSVLSLGTMGFGRPGHRDAAIGAVDADSAARMVRLALDHGVNLFDTADVYGAGDSETFLGAALGAERERALISTKVHARVGPGPNDVGQSRWHIIRACEASLRRLGTDHIDILHVHGYDACTAPEESLAALDSLVRDGKVRYIGCSNFTAWQIVKAVSVSRTEGLARFVAAQMYYNLLARELEWEIIPACASEDVGVLVWSPLAGGLLSGKYTRERSSLSGTRRAVIGDLGIGTVDQPRLWRILDTAAAIADPRGRSVAEVALNWLTAQRGVTSVILGARDAAQLTALLASTEWELTQDELARLDTVSRVPPPYPHWFQRDLSPERSSERGAARVFAHHANADHP